MGDEQFFPYNGEAKQMLDTDFELLEDDEEEGFVVLYRSTRDAEGSKNILKDDATASQIKAIRKDFRKHKLACNKRGSEIAEQINQATAIEEMYNYINWDKYTIGNDRDCRYLYSSTFNKLLILYTYPL